ncbi:7168_t:CDS:2, partial [Ambispora leptoticha]
MNSKSARSSFEQLAIRIDDFNKEVTCVNQYVYTELKDPPSLLEFFLHPFFLFNIFSYFLIAESIYLLKHEDKHVAPLLAPYLSVEAFEHFYWFMTCICFFDTTVLKLILFLCKEVCLYRIVFDETPLRYDKWFKSGRSSSELWALSKNYERIIVLKLFYFISARTYALHVEGSHYAANNIVSIIVA